MRLQHEPSDPVDSITGIHSDTAASCGPVKGNVHPTSHEGQDGEWRYSSTLSLNLGARWGKKAYATPRQLYPRESDPVANVEEAGWGPLAGLVGCRKCRPPPPMGLDPRTVQPVAVAIPTRPSRPTM